jgi:PII-like signaling protein
VIEDCAKLTVYFGERDRTGDRFLADALIDLFERRRVPASVLARGIEGFGIKQRLQSQRLLSLSEDLPLLAATVDRPDRMAALAPEASALCGDGVITLERARMLSGRLGDVALDDEPVKLTLWLGRHDRAGRRPAFMAVIDALQAAGVDGAAAFLGVDGTRDGVRHRARFFARNARIPLMLLAIGGGPAMAQALQAIDALVPEPLALLERVHTGTIADVPAGHALKVMVYAPEDAQAGGHALHVELIRRLRAAGADGATAIRGIWGYQGRDEVPGGDRLLGLRRSVPVVTTIIDAPERAAAWYPLVEELTAGRAVVTHEIVPARRAAAPGRVEGDLDL